MVLDGENESEADIDAVHQFIGKRRDVYGEHPSVNGGKLRNVDDRILRKTAVFCFYEDVSEGTGQAEIGRYRSDEHRFNLTLVEYVALYD